MKIKSLSIPVSTSIGEVSAEIMEPPHMKAVLVLAHGAGAGMNHRFMVSLAQGLHDLDIGTIRYNFPYMEKGKRRPDVPAVAEKTVAVIIEKTGELYPAVPLVAGGKSFGGRMTSQYLSKNSPEIVRAIVFYGFPLHPAGDPSIARAAHLKTVKNPMLFLQGTRDALAQLDMIEGVCQDLPLATLKKFEGADHSFKAGKVEIIPALAEATSDWITRSLT